MIKKIRFYILLISILNLNIGCLVTRQEVRDSVNKEVITQEQQKKANAELKYNEMDTQVRELLGKVEVLENKIETLNHSKEEEKKAIDAEKLNEEEKFKIFQEALTKLEGQYLALAQKIESLQVGMEKSTIKDSFESAEYEFRQQKWKQAIVAYEKYRSENPKGKKYAEATFKIAESFLELSMKSEVKVFYSEVTEKYSKSSWAKKAAKRLKTLK